jgi:hypothetical protein
LFFFSNQALEENLAMMDEEGVDCLLFFAIGLPFETAEDLEATAKYQKFLKNRFKRVKLMTFVIEIEPGGRLSNHPEAFEVTLHRSSFADYCEYHALPGQNHFQETGYYRKGCPTPDQVAEIFCKQFCPRAKVKGGLAPLICNAVSFAWKTGALHLVDKILQPGSKRIPRGVPALAERTTALALPSGRGTVPNPTRAPAVSIPAAHGPADSTSTPSQDRLVTISPIEDVMKRD